MSAHTPKKKRVESTLLDPTVVESTVLDPTVVDKTLVDETLPDRTERESDFDGGNVGRDALGGGGLSSTVDEDAPHQAKRAFDGLRELADIIRGVNAGEPYARKPGKPPKVIDTPEEAREYRRRFAANKHWIDKYYANSEVRKSFRKAERNLLKGKHSRAADYLEGLLQYAKTEEKDPKIAKRIQREVNDLFQVVDIPPRFTTSNFETLRRGEEQMSKAYYYRRPKDFARSRNELMDLAGIFSLDKDVYKLIRSKYDRPKYKKFAKDFHIDTPDQLFKEYGGDFPRPDQSTPLAYMPADLKETTIGTNMVFSPELSPISTSPKKDAPSGRGPVKKLDFDPAVVDAVMEDIRKMVLSNESRPASSTSE